jgi:hypothetical protein
VPALPADGLRYVLIVVFARAIVDNKSAANLKPQRLYPPARPPTHIDMRLIVMSGVGRASAPSPYPSPYPTPYPSPYPSPYPYPYPYPCLVQHPLSSHPLHPSSRSSKTQPAPPERQHSTSA